MTESISIKQLGLVYSVAMLTTACFSTDRGSPLVPSTPPPSSQGSPVPATRLTRIETEGEERKGSPPASDATGGNRGNTTLAIGNAPNIGSVAATATTTATTATTTTAGNDSRRSSISRPSSTGHHLTTQTGAASSPLDNSTTPESNTLEGNSSETENNTLEGDLSTPKRSSSISGPGMDTPSDVKTNQSDKDPHSIHPSLSRQRNKSTSSLPFQQPDHTHPGGNTQEEHKRKGFLQKIQERLRSSSQIRHNKSESESESESPSAHTSPKGKRPSQSTHASQSSTANTNKKGNSPGT